MRSIFRKGEEELNWLLNLQKTYENNAKLAGKFERNRFGREYALIPVSHTTQSAHVEVLLNLRGELLEARPVLKEEANTIIPCTEDSASRTSKPVPYPLFDKLQYVAGDYEQYCEPVKDNPHPLYLNQLREWCESPDAHPKVQSVYAYLSKGTLIHDLIEHKVLWTDASGRLLDKWTQEAEQLYGEKKEIFKALAGEQSSAFVRFAVEKPGEAESRIWRDPSVQDAYIRYVERQQAEKDLCFVTGEWEPCVDKHASRIRSSGDKSKLISANDSAGFTYRGRFKESREAAAIGFKASHQAHNALKWLIERQGFNLGGRMFVIWGTDDPDVPSFMESSFALYDEADLEEEEMERGDVTYREFADRVRKSMNGYRANLKQDAQVIIMVLDAATTGRMSVVYYRDMDKELFLDRLEKWHLSCFWRHQYGRTKEGKPFAFIGAPSVRDIAFAAYGPRVDERLEKGMPERLLPSILDGLPIPRDIVHCAVNRASNPVSMEPWEWEKTLSITCALVNKSKNGVYDVSLDVKNDDRDYLFGRLLAIADVLERSALGPEEKRATNATRFMNAFAQHPARTWKTIQSSLVPYQARLGTRATRYTRLLDEVLSMIKPEDFNNKPLAETYLLGHGAQRHALYQKRTDKNGTEAVAVDTSEDEMMDEEE